MLYGDLAALGRTSTAFVRSWSFRLTEKMLLWHLAALRKDGSICEKSWCFHPTVATEEEEEEEEEEEAEEDLEESPFCPTNTELFAD